MSIVNKGYGSSSIILKGYGSLSYIIEEGTLEESSGGWITIPKIHYRQVTHIRITVLLDDKLIIRQYIMKKMPEIDIEVIRERLEKSISIEVVDNFIEKTFKDIKISIKR